MNNRKTVIPENGSKKNEKGPSHLENQKLDWSHMGLWSERKERKRNGRWKGQGRVSGENE